MMRHGSLRPVDLHDNTAGIRSDALMRIKHPVRGPDERLFEIHRVVDPRDQGHRVAVTVKSLDGLCRIAPGPPVAADPSHLEMRRRDDERIAFPLPRRESLPRV